MCKNLPDIFNPRYKANQHLILVTKQTNRRDRAIYRESGYFFCRSHCSWGTIRKKKIIEADWNFPLHPLPLGLK
jgi:hypothetical protein